MEVSIRFLGVLVTLLQAGLMFVPPTEGNNDMSMPPTSPSSTPSPSPSPMPSAMPPTPTPPPPPPMPPMPPPMPGGPSAMPAKWYGSQMEDMDMVMFMQPNRIGRDRKYDDFSKDDGYLCTRDCCKYPKPRLCYFQFTVEQYTAMGPACKNCTKGIQEDCLHPQCITADGIERMVYSIDRMIPGPIINVCKGDRIVIDVSNMMTSAALAIHWHGVLQTKTPWMDGVPFITQCPIGPMGGIFRYDFWVEEALTHFYHAHAGRLQGDGVYSALVVRECEAPNKNQYDHDIPSHTLIVADWTHYPSDIYFPGYYLNATHIPIKPDVFLINGLGSYSDTLTKTNTPHYEVHVESGGSRYLLRIIASTTSVCLFKIAIEDHSMTIIAMDGYPCEPKEVNSAILGAGARLDVVIKTKKKEEHPTTCSYNIVVKGTQDCENTTSVQTAYLVYDDCNVIPTSKPDFPTIYNKGPYFEDLERGCEKDDVHCSYEFKSSVPLQPQLLEKKEPDHRYFMVLGANSLTFDELFNNVTYPYQFFHIPTGGIGKPKGGMVANFISNVSGMMPWFPILYQTDPIPPDMLCNGKCKDNQGFCYCINIIKVELNSTVQLVFSDAMASSGQKRHHPMHIHGHNWVVRKQGYMEELMKDPNGYFLNTGDIRDRPKRDVILIPDGGYAVVEFVANNPGMWMMHCHFEEHLLSGMFLIFQVGEREQFLKVPDKFPRCSAYTPKITNLDDYKCQPCKEDLCKTDCKKTPQDCSCSPPPNASPPPSSTSPPPPTISPPPS